MGGRRAHILSRSGVIKIGQGWECSTASLPRQGRRADICKRGAQVAADLVPCDRQQEFGPWSCWLAERHRHTAAKHGVIGRTEIAALEYTEDHVRVRPAVMVVQPMRSVEDGQPNTIL